MSARLFNIFFISFLFLTGSLGIYASSDTLSEDEAAIAANITALHSEKSEVREDAAKELRRIIAKYSSGTSNIRSKDGGEAYWTEKVNQVVPGMTEMEVANILPPFGEAGDGMGAGSGDSHLTSYRLDYDWLVAVQYRNPVKVIEIPKLIRRELIVNVPLPPNYTGTWISWYVNGNKGREFQYKEGQLDGVLTGYHDNGRPADEHHYTMNVVEGPDAAWYPDGKISYTGQYKNGKQDGKWIHYYPTGVKSAEVNHKNGEFYGLHSGWYENGQLRFETNYVNGVMDGIDAAWNDQGVLQYKREFKNGKIVPEPH